MAFPPGVSLAVIEAGKAFTAVGSDVSMTAKVTPIFRAVGGGTIKRIVHAATGHPMLSSTEEFKAQAGAVLSFAVPHVDQPGWQAPSGEAYTMWYYAVEITARVGNGRNSTGHVWKQNVQPLVGQDFIDLDLIADGPTGEPVTAPQAVVTSVDGQTGAVTLGPIVGTAIDQAVLDGRIPQPVVTESAPGVYEIGDGGQVYGLTPNGDLPSTTIVNLDGRYADKSTALTINEGPLNLARYAEDRPELGTGAAFQEALDILNNVQNDRGGEAYLDKGWYYIDTPLEIGQYTVLRGAGRNATTILASDAFPTASPVIRGGKTGVNGALFGQRIENLTVNCRHRVPVGIYSERWNEKSGLRDMTVENFTRYGVHVPLMSGEVAQGYDIMHIEATMSNTAAEADAIGVYLGATPRVFDNATINVTTGAGALTGSQVAVLLDGFKGDARNLHWENMPTGLVIGRQYASAGFSVHNITGQATVNTNMVITGGLGTTGFVLSQIKANGSPTNLVDNVNNKTSTEQRIGVWQSGAGTTGQQYFFTDQAAHPARVLGLDVRGLLRALRVNITDAALDLQRTAENFPRFRLLTDGKMLWGAGSANPDTELYLFSSKRLRTNAAVTTSEFLESQNAAGGIILATPSGGRYRLTINDAGDWVKAAL